MRTLRRLLKGLGFTVLAAVLAGGIYQQIGTRIAGTAVACRRLVPVPRPSGAQGLTFMTGRRSL